MGNPELQFRQFESKNYALQHDSFSHMCLDLNELNNVKLEINSLTSHITSVQ